MAVTIGGTTGITIPATATNQSGAVAWVNFNGTSGASPVIRASYNVSSVVRNGTGDYTVTFTNALVDANYCINVSVSPDYAASTTTVNLNVQNAGLAEVAPTTTTFRFLSSYPGTATRADAKYASVSIFR